MEKTINRIESILGNLHDVYSKDEVESLLKTILLSLQAEEERENKYKKQEIDPEHYYSVLRDQYKDVLRGIKKGLLNNLQPESFEDCVSLELSGNEIEIEVDHRSVIEIVVEELVDIMPDEDQFLDDYKEIIEDINEDQTETELKIMELKSEFKNPATSKTRRFEIMKELWDDYKVDYEGNQV